MGLTLSSRLSLGLSGGRRAYTFVNSEASSLVARMSVAPSNARKAQIDTFVGALKSASLWSKLDALWVLAAHDSQAGRINWISSSYTLTLVNSPAFTTDRGFAGDGSSSYINTGLNLSATSKAAQNSNSAGVWSRDAGGINGVELGGTDFHIQCRSTTDQATFRNAATTTNTLSNTDGAGLVAMSRTGSADFAVYNNATNLGPQTRTSAAFASQEVLIFARNDGAGNPTVRSSRQLALAFIGSGLADADVQALYNAANTYLSAIGAA